MWGSSIEGKGRKRKGINKGEFFPLCTGRDTFSLPVVFLCLLFLLLVFKSLILRRRLSAFWGIIKGFTPL